MKAQENYWTYRAASDTPDLRDLPPDTFAGDEAAWHKLSPGFRREIYRYAIKRAEAQAREVTP